MNTITLDIRSLHLTNQQFFDLCQVNRDMRLELTAQGEMIVMTPAGGETGNRNLSIGSQLWNWNEQTRLGVAFDSSTGFILPNGKPFARCGVDTTGTLGCVEQGRAKTVFAAVSRFCR